MPMRFCVQRAINYAHSFLLLTLSFPGVKDLLLLADFVENAKTRVVLDVLDGVLPRTCASDFRFVILKIHNNYAQNFISLLIAIHKGRVWERNRIPCQKMFRMQQIRPNSTKDYRAAFKIDRDKSDGVIISVA